MVFKISRECIISAVSVILRVPALFIAEVWYRRDPKSVYQQLHGRHLDKPQEFIATGLYYSAIVFALTLVILPLRRLVNFYMYIVSVALLALAHHLSHSYVQAEKSVRAPPISVFEDPDAIQRLGLNLAVQCVIGAVVAYLVNIGQWSRITLLAYTLPMLARAGNVPVSELHRVHNFASVFVVMLVAFYAFNHLPHVLDLLKGGLQQMQLAVQLYGWIPFLVAMWFKILMPMQFLIFWLLLFALQLYKYSSYLSVHNHPVLAEGWLVVFFASVAECCVTPITLIGLCYTVSYAAYVVLAFTKFYLQGWQAYVNDNVMHRGWTEGFTMFLLSVQTGIIELKSPQRAFLMSIVLFIVLSSLIQSMYEIADPILLQLAASQNKNVCRHARAIALCTVLWIVPLVMTRLICRVFEMDFWLMVIISSCVITSVQTLGSLVVYGLFMYDAIRSEAWEKLDDVVYYTKATTRVMEFLVAVFVVCYGMKESIFGEWSWINMSILLVHCYFNVWQRLQAGWKAYLLRREAARRIESLPEATEAQLIEHNDRCAICFQDMQSARITPCQHYFHALCLRKWFYVQDHCPMCHKKISLSKPDDVENSANSANHHSSADGPSNQLHQPIHENPSTSSSSSTDSDDSDQNDTESPPGAYDRDDWNAVTGTATHHDAYLHPGGAVYRDCDLQSRCEGVAEQQRHGSRFRASHGAASSVTVSHLQS